MNQPVGPAGGRNAQANDNNLGHAVPQRPACPVCGGPLVEIKQKLQCAQCRTICETCCEGGRG